MSSHGKHGKHGIILCILISVLSAFSARAQVPTIQQVSPEFGPVGTEVTITGTNFTSDATVFFGPVKSSITSVNSTQIKTKVPIGAAYKPVSISVNRLSGASPKPFIVTSVNETRIGAASFSEGVSFEAANGPYDIAASDIDGDGKVDLITAGFRSISVFRNTSTQGGLSRASFAQRTDIVADAVSANSIAIADINADGKLDIVSISAGANASTVTVLINNSVPGIISPASFTRHSFNTAPNPQKVAVADLDNDGQLDLVTANGGNNLSVLRKANDPNAILFENHLELNSTTPGTAETVTIADMDLDGKQDLIEYNLSNNVYTISVLRNLSTPAALNAGTFALPVSYGSGVISDSDIVVGDLDNDGRPEIVANYGSANTLSVLKNLSVPGNFTATSFGVKVDFGTGTNPWCGKTMADLNGDRFPDLVSTNRESATVSLFQNRGQNNIINTASFFPKVDLVTGQRPTGVVAADLDGDGMTDIAALSRDSRTATIYRNQMADPQPTAFAPVFGNSGTSLTITGSNFGNDVANVVVKINGATATIVSITPISIVATVPTFVNTGPVTVSRRGATGAAPGEFTCIPVSISHFTPAAAFSGDVITIIGNGFSLGRPNNVVRMSGVEATVVSCNAREIKAIVPAGIARGKISVTTNGFDATTGSDLIVTPVRITAAAFPELFVVGGGPVSASVSYTNADLVRRILFYSRGISAHISTIKEEVLQPAANGVSTISIPGERFNDPIGLEMKWTIVDRDGNEITRSAYAYKKYTAGDESQNIAGLGIGKSVENYSIISIPLDLTDRSAAGVFRDLGEFDKYEWRAFTFENQKPEELVPDSRIYAGRGYWFISKKDVVVNPGEGTSVRVTDMEPFILQLKPGWNMIGNPYNFSLSWESVLSANRNPQSIGTLRVFTEGTFAESSTLGKFQGGIVRNSGSSIMYLKVPVYNVLGPGRKNAEEGPGNWQIRLSITDGRITNTLGGFGMNTNASEQLDHFDEPALPLPDGMQSFELIMRKDKEDIIKDIVPVQPSYTWQGSLSTKQGVTVSWNTDISSKLESELWMQLPGHINAVDMKSNGSIHFPPGDHSFRIAYGKSPNDIKELIIGDPASNPLKRNAEKLLLPVNLLESSNDICLTLIDLKGSTILKSFFTNFSKGRHNLEWVHNFSNLSPGLYILSVSVNGTHSVRRKLIIE